MPWLPEYRIDSTQLWRIATGVRLETLQYYLGKRAAESVFSVGGSYILLPESAWQNACHRAQTEGDDYFVTASNSWYNPHQMRPGWLLQKKEQLK